MKKRILAIFLLVALAVSLFAGCGKKDNGFVTAEEAQKIAMEAVGVTKKEVADVHPHTGVIEDVPHYNIHLTLKDGREFNVIINAATGEVVDGI